jgi:chromosome segregation ATPase
VPTSGKLIRPPSASYDLRHAAEEIFSAGGCIAATGRQPRNTTQN